MRGPYIETSSPVRGKLLVKFSEDGFLVGPVRHTLWRSGMSFVGTRSFGEPLSYCRSQKVAIGLSSDPKTKEVRKASMKHRKSMFQLFGVYCIGWTETIEGLPVI